MKKTMTVTIGDGEIYWYRGVYKVPRTTSCWLCQFARWVLRTGVDPDTALRPLRDGQPTFRDATLRWWAGRTTVESATESVYMRNFVPFKGDDE